MPFDGHPRFDEVNPTDAIQAFWSELYEPLGEPTPRPRPYTRKPIAPKPYDPSEDLIELQVEAMPDAIRQNWSRIALSKLSDQSYLKLRQIANRPDNWRGFGSKKLNPQSLMYFLEFWKLVRDHATEPHFAITPAGHIQTEWFKNTRRYLDIEFSENGSAFYGLFDGKSVHEGIENIAVLANMLLARPRSPLQWSEN